MRLSVWVPYDEEGLRRTIRFVIRPRLRLLRLLGAVLVALGLLLVALDPSTPLYYGVVALGVVVALVVEPVTVAWTVRTSPTSSRTDST